MTPQSPSTSPPSRESSAEAPEDAAAKADGSLPGNSPLPEARSSDLSPATESPLSLAESHARLELNASKLGVLVREAKAKADEANVLYRQLRDELDETTRGIRAIARVRGLRPPQKRAKP